MMNNFLCGRIGFFGVLLVVFAMMLVCGCGDPPKEFAFPTATTSAVDSELIVGWGGKDRQLATKSIVEDFGKNGVPGGGEANEVIMMVFYKSDGKAFIVDMHGNEILPCAALVDSQIVPVKITDGKVVLSGDESDLCSNLKDTNITGMRENVTIYTRKSPKCPIRSYGGYLIQRCP